MVKRLFELKQAFHGQVLVQLLPVDSDSASDQAPVVAGVGRGVAQTREPFQGHGNFAAIGQAHP